VIPSIKFNTTYLHTFQKISQNNQQKNKLSFWGFTTNKARVCCISSYGSSPFFVVMNGGSAIKRDLEFYAPSVHARPVIWYTVVTVFVSFRYSS
jgi:hypothetical protein